MTLVLGKGALDNVSLDTPGTGSVAVEAIKIGTGTDDLTARKIYTYT